MILNVHKPKQGGYILIGALALAVIIAVGVSMAIRGSQQKMAEARAKEANIQAKLVMDSSISRLITYLDRSLERDGEMSAAKVMDWISTAGFVTSGSSSSNTAYIVQFSANPTTGITPVNTSADLSLYSLCQNDLRPKNAADPLFPDFRMNKMDFQVQVVATSLNTNKYPSFTGTYTLQIRAIPETEWAYFDPGSLAGPSVTLSLDNTINRTTDQNQVHAYIGQIQDGTINAYGAPLAQIEAFNSPINSRFWRGYQPSTPNFSYGGNSKWANSSSVGLSTFAGTALYDNTANITPPSSDAALEVWGTSYVIGQSNNVATEDTLDQYSGAINNSVGNYTANAIPALRGTTVGPIVNQYGQNYYNLITIPPGNPFYDLSGGSGQVAVMDLHAFLVAQKSQVGYIPGGSIIVPTPNLAQAQAIWVTNCSDVGAPNEEVNITFPPSIRVFFGDDVNTAHPGTPTRLKVEGNLGFTPAFTNINILEITNYTGNPRIQSSVTSVDTFETLQRSDLPIDFANDPNLATGVRYDPGLTAGDPASVALFQKLKAWANTQKATLLNQIPNSSGEIWDMYVFPQVEGLNQYYDTSALNPGQDMPGTVVPIPIVTTDVATNMPTGISTNLITQFNYIGVADKVVNCSNAVAGWYGLSQDFQDQYTDPKVQNWKAQDFVTSVTNYDTSITSSGFTVDLIKEYDALLPSTVGTIASYLKVAAVVAWNPEWPNNQDHSTYPFDVSLDAINDLNYFRTNNAVANPAAINKMPFAIAWMTGESTNNVDSFQELLTPVTVNGATAFQTNAITLSAISSADMYDNETTWKDFIYSNWVSYIGDLTLTPDATLGLNNDRYDMNGALVTQPDNDYGSWKGVTTILSKGTVSMNADLSSKIAIPSLNGDLITLPNEFTYRQVAFHFMTLGWTKTNIVTVAGPAPLFNGRMIAEDGIKQLGNLVPTNQVINGQLTLTHRIKSKYLTPAVENKLLQFGVNYNRNTQPAQGAERLYDIRISRVDISRAP